MIKLESTTRHPGVVASLNLQRSFPRQQLPSFFHAAVSRVNGARQDQGLRTIAAFYKAAIHKQLVRPLFCLTRDSVTPARSRWTIAPSHP